jgi:hypothetical protein
MREKRRDCPPGFTWGSEEMATLSGRRMLGHGGGLDDAPVVTQGDQHIEHLWESFVCCPEKGMLDEIKDRLRHVDAAPTASGRFAENPGRG